MMGSKPSRAERTAQQWHDTAHQGPAYDDCWCRCRACRLVNPHYRAACRAAVADIFARIADSIATTQPPKRKLPW